MNHLFLQLGIASWKPVLTALLLPPMPFLGMLIVGAWLLGSRKSAGRMTSAAGVVLLWLSCCNGISELIAPTLLRLPNAVTAAQIDEFRAHAGEPVAIIVLGGGVQAHAPEYGDSNLEAYSLERLRYGIWLSRRTGWPTGFSGGVGWGQRQTDQTAEAVVAQRVATQEFQSPLRWVESTSRDTRENAINTVAILRRSGVRHVVLVTHVWHMPRALRNFDAASAGTMSIVAAPIGLAKPGELPILRWLPSGDGLTNVRLIVREWLGGMAGA